MSETVFCSKKTQYPVCPVCGEICDAANCRNCGRFVGCDPVNTARIAAEESGWIPNGD